MATAAKPVFNLRMVATVCAVAACAVALAALFGWTFDIPALHGDETPVLLPVAFAFLVFGGVVAWLALESSTSPRQRRIVRAIAALMAGFSLLACSDSPEVRFKLHQFLEALLPFRQKSTYDPELRAGFAPLLFALALLLFHANGRWSRRFFVAAVLIPILTALLALIGHACGLPSFYGWNSFALKAAVSLPGALAAVFLGVALFAAKPNLEIAEMVASRTMGGYVARWLLLTPIVIPLANGLLLKAVQDTNFYDPEIAGWFFSFANIGVFTVVIGGIALLLHRMDLKRRDAERTIRELNDSLEDQVNRRTDQLTEAKLQLEREIRERARAEEHLLRAQRVECIGAVAGGIAHDLNNMLAPIRLACGILESTDDPLERKRFLSIINQSAQRGSDLVRQILLFARGVSGGMRTVEVPALISDLKRTLDSILPRSISLAVNCPDDIPPIHGDPTQLSQVFMNLCINSRDAMPEGGAIQIDVTAARDSTRALVQIKVRDTGHGIPEQHRSRIFEPFFTTKAPTKGTGLGLATVRRIVEQHGGAITLESHVGHGTTFSITLPAAPPEPASHAAPEAGATLGHGEHILVVEDEDALRQIIRATLEHSGYRVSLARNGLEAVALLKENGDIDLALTDCDMPVLGGGELLERLRSEWPSLRVVAMSGALLASHRPPKPGAPAPDARLDKPFSTERLLQTLRDTLCARPT